MTDRYPEWRRLGQAYTERIKREQPHAAAAWTSFEALSGAPQPYVPTHSFNGATATPRHREIADAPGGRMGLPFLIDLGVDGFLHKAEALKLYEMAYFSRGDVLELGTHKGLSTTILAHGLHDRVGGRLETVDIDEATNPIAKRNVAGRPGAERVTFILQDATARLDALAAEKRQFDFAFVDHWHGYDATFEAATRLPGLVTNGGYVMFHDFFDPANADPAHVYGVYQAVVDVFGDKHDFSFVGAAGGSALFRRTG